MSALTHRQRWSSRERLWQVAAVPHADRYLLAAALDLEAALSTAGSA